MNPNYLGVISAVLAIAAFSVTYCITKSKSSKTRVLLCFIALVASIPGASFAIYYSHIIPEANWYYLFRSIAGTEFLVIMLGVAGGLGATLLPRVFLIIPLLGVAVFSIVPVMKPFMGPLREGQLKDKWDDEICLQSTASTCGAASLASILKHLGIDATEAELAAEAHSYRGGTEAWYLARAARSRGLDVSFDFSTTFTPDRGLPAIVGVSFGPTGHFIAIIGKEGSKFIVGDPLCGRELLSHEELMNRYTFTGFHMRVTNFGEQDAAPN